MVGFWKTGVMVSGNVDAQIVSALKTMVLEYDKYNLLNISNWCLRIYSEENTLDLLEKIVTQ
jgi:hypothetical protein